MIIYVSKCCTRTHLSYDPHGVEGSLTCPHVPHDPHLPQPPAEPCECVGPHKWTPRSFIPFIHETSQGWQTWCIT